MACVVAAGNMMLLKRFALCQHYAGIPDLMMSMIDTAAMLCGSHAGSQLRQLLSVTWPCYHLMNWCIKKPDMEQVEDISNDS